MSTQPLLNALRVAFFIGTLCAVFTTLRWGQLRRHVVKLDASLIQRHTEGPTESFEAALADLRAGEEEKGLDALTDLAEDLRDVRLGTRLAGVRTNTLDQLSARHLAADRNEEAMAWTEELLEYNPRDFPALVRRAELHRRAGNDAAELVDIDAAFKVGAAPGPAIGPFIDAMARRGQREELATALLGLGHAGPLVLPVGGWEFRWSNGANSNYAITIDLLPEKVEGTGFLRGGTRKLPNRAATIQQMRVDLPQGIHAKLRSVTVELSIQDGTKRIIDLTNSLRMSHLTEMDGGWLLADGRPDPYIVMQSPEPDAFGGVLHASVTLDVVPMLPASAIELFAGGITDEERAAWTERFGAEMVAALEASLDH